MKKLFLTLAVIFLGYSLYAQTPTQVMAVPGGSTYVYVGSLTASVSDGGNDHKIIVKILGGSFFSDSNGETTFYISNRGGLAINKTSLGSNTTYRLVLKAYQNGGNTDFYIAPLTTEYASFAVSSFTYGYGISSGYVNISTQSTAPTGTDITSSIAINNIMVTDSNGNIGVGTNTPDTKLAVAGTIHAKEVKVDLTGWPDYVFKANYKFPSLTEVKAYIEKNQRLPEMPSDQDVAKNGIKVGELIKLQTKKIEELTLYLIDKDDQLNRLQNELSELRKQLSSLSKLVVEKMPSAKKTN